MESAARRTDGGRGEAGVTGGGDPSGGDPALTGAARPGTRGKVLALGDDTLWVRGVTYGTFRPDGAGQEFHDRARVTADFRAMAGHGINTVRVYTVPPRWLLDTAAREGLRVMVGLPWEQHIAFLDDPARARSIEARVRAGVRACAGHPAVLCYAIGNEIPASIVRWHGARRIERFLERLYRAAKEEDPLGLVTYVNFPSTEYLRLPFLDLICFNVYLESRDRLAAYLARLQNLAGERPLLMAEVGLDSRRHGLDAQAEVLDWQIRTTFAAGCAGVLVFSWTDEWHRGGVDVDDWDFGLTARDRAPKPALAAVREAFAEVPFAKSRPWPRVSVVVCSYNGSRTLRDCLDGLLRLEYQNYEVIVVDDGSTDGTGAIAREYGFRVISTENRGLASARNLGLAAASGEIVAYIDDDAYPDPYWLTYLASAFMESSHVGVGGPNLPPPGDGPVAECVSSAPGGPVHVLLSDGEAEHIPGCNMAFRKAALEAIGGFDPRYRRAGDDVDICWRLQARGWTIGFHAAAVVWHHRRNSVRAYWRQQVGYGEAEALLEEKWPEKYNAVGHLSWAGRLYGRGLTAALRWPRGRVYQGPGGTAPFQSLYEPAAGLLASLPLMPEWYLVVGLLALVSALEVLWRPMALALPLLALAVAAPVAQAATSAARAPHAPGRVGLRALTAVLHLAQPLARLWGRLGRGLTPWRRRGGRGLALPRPRTTSIWSEQWWEAPAWLARLEAALRDTGAPVHRGGDWDRWDLEVRAGLLGRVRLRLAIEEHGHGRQHARVRSWPRPSPGGLGLGAVVGVLGVLAWADGAWAVGLGLAAVAAVVGVAAMRECAAATRAAQRALARLR